MADTTPGFQQGGLYKKFRITRTDGVPIPETAEFYVLRLDNGKDGSPDDPHARVAADFYARSVEEDNPALSAEILEGLDRLEEGGTFYKG